ncbi:phosphatidate cytidylyltransferase [Candidatus Palauibacter polyketidifaciens]|uniref:phosphatidate cytidylyltransferase n=1 Tax=Candidatus Palauibacter polyketidifaciens TaxID=3056740 RepID=UPI00139B8FF2|nr:phosphatidate cytidylyltransferase [Candidatus Palauibacter polyketidifaciens]MDE2721088.1 phosphatidate cytidylyltransferase [Candidatus Palauibacter polyketidifaciens]MYE34428.1 phosphatidate cytidylyltransferase [Gemmatimonadales bacterium]
MSSNLHKRLAVAGVGVPLCALATYAGGVVFVTGLGVAAALGYREFAAMMRGTGTRVLGLSGAVAAFLFPFAVFAGGLESGGFYAVGLMLLFPVLALTTADLSERPIRAAACTAFGVFYVGGLLALGLPLREGELLLPAGADASAGRMAGTLLFFFPVVITWLADTAAYLGGRTLGKRPLAPRISPNKTVAGAVSALLAGLATAVLYPRFLLRELWTLELAPTLAFGFVVTALAIVGDLVESALKRECGVKDSSRLLPGHGGMLDRLDSILWAVPAAFLFLFLFA